MHAFILGFVLSFSLIVAIGAQNIFVIRQSVINQYPYMVAFLCFLSDAVLIGLGVTSLSLFLNHHLGFEHLLLYLGAAFLLCYGGLSLTRGLLSKENVKLDDKAKVASRTKVILLALSFSLLNPQALMETLVIIGGSAVKFYAFDKYIFLMGAVTASFIWFFLLMFTSRLASAFLTRPIIWRLLDILSGSIMLYFAYRLLFHT